MSHFGVPLRHQHQRSASREIDLIIDLARSCPPEPYYGHQVPNGAHHPFPVNSSPPDRPFTSINLNTSGAKCRTCTQDHTSLHRSKPHLTRSDIWNRSFNMPTTSSPSDEPRATTPEGKNIQMSLVSPPFTPSASDVDLVSSHMNGGLNATELMEPLDLNQSETKIVRSQLDERLPNVFCESRARIPTTNGTEIFLHVYRNDVDNKEHLAIVFGSDIYSKTLFEPREGETEHDRMTRGAYTGKLYPGRLTSTAESEQKDSVEELPTTKGASTRSADVLCRIHSECYTGETAWSARCDCGEQLDEAARLMAEEGRGVIVYLRQEGRGIGLGEKLKAYNLQDLGADTVQANLMLRHPADGRSFGLATAILKDLGLNEIRLMTNNPDKIVAVEGKHKEITVTQRVPMIPLSWQKKGGFQSKEVDKYLSTKIERMGHLLER